MIEIVSSHIDAFKFPVYFETLLRLRTLYQMFVVFFAEHPLYFAGHSVLYNLLFISVFSSDIMSEVLGKFIGHGSQSNGHVLMIRCPTTFHIHLNFQGMRLLLFTAQLTKYNGMCYFCFEYIKFMKK